MRLPADVSIVTAEFLALTDDAALRAYSHGNLSSYWAGRAASALTTFGPQPPAVAVLDS
jgi:hypothetical protein